MNNKLIISAICFFLFTGFSCSQVPKSYEEINLFKVNFVNKDISTPFAIGCDIFETFFKSSYKELTIDDLKEIRTIKSCLNKFKLNSNVNNVDVRVKVYMYNNEKLISIFCFDQLGNIILDNKYLQNTCLVNFINQKIEAIK